MVSIITLSSHVAHGAVGNRIIVPALEKLGVTVTAVSTIALPWHPGMNGFYGKGTRIVPDDQAFTAMMHNLADAPWLSQIDGIMTGYLGSPEQAIAIAALVKALKQANPKALYLCDPVTGDNGGLYVPETTAAAIRDHLWPLADIVTPNLFEFGWMTGQISTDVSEIIQAAKALSKRHVVVTSVGGGENKIGNLLVSETGKYLVTHKALSPTPNGTGDLLAALLLGYLVKGDAAVDALAKTAKIVVSAIKHANRHQKSSLSPENLRDVMDMHEAVEMVMID